MLLQNVFGYTSVLSIKKNMYSNQSLYYLQQLGITPWLRRERSIQAAPRLLVFIPDVLSESAKRLLDNLLSFLDLKSQEFRIISINKENTYTHPEGCDVLALIFGEFLPEFLKDNAMPKIVTFDLALLMEQPLKKKRVFNHLLQVKQFMSSLV